MFAHLNESFTPCLYSAFWVTAALIVGIIIVPAKLQQYYRCQDAHLLSKHCTFQTVHFSFE